MDEIPCDGEYILPGLAKSYLDNLEKIKQTGKGNISETQSFSRVLKNFGIAGKVGFHSFRSTVITKLRAAGIDAKEIGGLVGHSSEKQTEHYNKNALKIDVFCLKYM